MNSNKIIEVYKCYKYYTSNGFNICFYFFLIIITIMYDNYYCTNQLSQ